MLASLLAVVLFARVNGSLFSHAERRTYEQGATINGMDEEARSAQVVLKYGIVRPTPACIMTAFCAWRVVFPALHAAAVIPMPCGSQATRPDMAANLVYETSHHAVYTYLHACVMLCTPVALGPGCHWPGMNDILILPAKQSSFIIQFYGIVLQACYSRVECSRCCAAEVNSLTSFETGLPYEPYSLPFCKPQGGVEKTSSSFNAGDLLSGLQLYNSPYQFHVDVRP